MFAKFQIMVGFALFLFRRSPKIIDFQKNRTQNRPKTPISSFFFSLGLLFLGLGTEQQLCLARTARNCPRRRNTSPEQETSIICVTYVRTKGQRYTLRHYNYQVSHEGQALWRSHADARPRLGPAKSHGGGLAGCRCNIDETAVCFVLTLSLIHI